MVNKKVICKKKIDKLSKSHIEKIFYCIWIFLMFKKKNNKLLKTRIKYNNYIILHITYSKKMLFKTFRI